MRVMEIVVVNLTTAGPARRETLNGRKYLVAPITSIVPGVLNGSQGALYYPDDEVARDPLAWNGMPLVFWHPKDAEGNHVSARSPAIQNKFGAGFLYESVFNGKLQHEGWFDEELTLARDKAFGTNVYHRLEVGEPIEMSTGLFTDNEPAPKGSHHNGVPYSYIARNYRPDHIAVLPDQKGACSNRDGCGINVNEEKRTLWQKIGALLGIANCGGAGGTMGPCPGGGGSGESKPSDKPLRETYGTRTPAVKSKIRDLEDGPLSYLAGKTPKEAYDEIDKVEKLHTEALASLQKVASEKIGLERGSYEHQEWEAYQARSGKQVLSSQWAKDAGIPAKEAYLAGVKKTREAVKFFEKRAAKPKPTETDNQEGEPVNKKQLIGWLVANCDGYKGQEKALESFNDEALKKLQANQSKLIIVVNAAKAHKAGKLFANADGEGDGGGGVDIAALAELLGITADPGTDPGGYIKEMGEKLSAVTKQLGIEVKTPDTAAPPAADEPPPVAMGADEPKDKEPAGNRRAAKPQTDQQWLDAAPPGIQAVVRNAMSNIAAEKRQLADRLVANVADPAQRAAKHKRLMTKPVEELRDLVELIPAPAGNNGYVPPNQLDSDSWLDLVGNDGANYAGAGSGGYTPTANDEIDEPLQETSIDFTAIRNERLAKQRVG